MKIKVYVTYLDPSHIASKVKGYFMIDSIKIRFNGIAFGRIGGHNINIKISKKDEQRLKDLGYDPEQVIVEVQRLMVQGDMEIIEKG